MAEETTINWKQKLTSRKFLFAAAAGLSSLGTGVLGMANIIPDAALPYVITGNICLVVSAALYSFCEAYVDGKRLASETTTTTTTISATSTSKEIVQTALNQPVVPEVPKSTE